MDTVFCVLTRLNRAFFLRLSSGGCRMVCFCRVSDMSDTTRQISKPASFLRHVCRFFCIVILIFPGAGCIFSQVHDNIT